MKENKEMTEQELDNVTAGAAFVKFDGVMQRRLNVSPVGITDPLRIPGDTFRPTRNNIAERNANNGGG